MSKNNKSTEELPLSEEDEIFKLLTHQTRRNIIKILGERNLSFSQIKNTLDIDSPTLSYHLKSMKPFVIQKKSKYSFSEIGKAALYLLTKTDQSITMSKYKRYFWYIYFVTWICYFVIGAIMPLTILYIPSIDDSIFIFEILLNVVGVINMSVIGFLKSRYI
ncbi:MAG: winged helix-turn-helix domain-containing protein [Promethearchaeota archaeon]